MSKISIFGNDIVGPSQLEIIEKPCSAPIIIIADRIIDGRSLDEFGFDLNLTTLDASFNQLRPSPRLCLLTSIQILILREVGREFFIGTSLNLPNLIHLDIADNMLTSLPDIGPSVRELGIAGNRDINPLCVTVYKLRVVKIYSREITDAWMSIMREGNIELIFEN